MLPLDLQFGTASADRYIQRNVPQALPVAVSQCPYVRLLLLFISLML